MTIDELSDIFVVVQRVGNMIQKHYQASSLTIVVQDGADAGQTVPHFHVHIIPRRPNDFDFNDDVYDILENRDPKHRHRVDEDISRKPRSEQEMASEASLLSSLLQDISQY